MRRSTLRGRLREERGSSLIEMLLALGLVALVVAIGVQAFAYAQARLIAAAAAQDGARAAASAGPEAGLARSREVLAAGGGAARGLAASVSEQRDGVTVSVVGKAVGLFPLALIVPAIRADATLPVELYPADERAAP